MNTQSKETTADHKVAAGPYARYFSRRDRADLATANNTDDLSAEAALLRLLIGRQLTQPPSESLPDGGTTFRVDASQIRRYIQTLCRVLTVHHSLAKTGQSEAEEALDRVLKELMEEDEARALVQPPAPWKPSLASSP
jgi:hypothetical protein